MTATKREGSLAQTNGTNGHVVNGKTSPPVKGRNAWDAPGSAAFDFRSAFAH